MTLAPRVYKVRAVLARDKRLGYLDALCTCWRSGSQGVVDIATLPSFKNRMRASAGMLTRGDSLTQALDPRDNALNFMRLLLAVLVIVGHTYIFGGYGASQAQGPFVTLGFVCVDAFFAISGFLITRSWDRGSHWGRYLWHRVLRIFPGFWVCLLVTSLIIAPINAWHAGMGLSGYFSDENGPLGYFKHYFMLQNLRHGGLMGIAGTPTGIPYQGSWNGAIWTLSYEFLCYLGVGAVGSLIALRKRRVWALGAAAILWAVCLMHEAAPQIGATYLDHPVVMSLLRFTLMFMTGAVLYLYADRVRINAALAVLAALLFGLGLGLLADYRVLGSLALAYLVIWLGIRLPIRVGVRTDISYGMYVYGFPVQQLLAVFGAYKLGWPAFAVFAVAGTVPLAFASWFAIERPALRLKNWSPGHRGIPEDAGTPPAAQGDVSSVERVGEQPPVAVATGGRRAKVVGAVVMIALFAAYIALKLMVWPNI
jgi:peptidoglycan/LPS O-acetylase OafA/YrhL